MYFIYLNASSFPCNFCIHLNTMKMEVRWRKMRWTDVSSRWWIWRRRWRWGRRRRRRIRSRRNEMENGPHHKTEISTNARNQVNLFECLSNHRPHGPGKQIIGVSLLPAGDDVLARLRRWNSTCPTLWRRRSPVFAHGFVESGDVSAWMF